MRSYGPIDYRLCRKRTEGGGKKAKPQKKKQQSVLAPLKEHVETAACVQKSYQTVATSVIIRLLVQDKQLTYKLL